MRSLFLIAGPSSKWEEAALLELIGSRLQQLIRPASENTVTGRPVRQGINLSREE